MHRSFLLILAALLPVAACGGKHSGDTDTGSSGGSDTGDTGGDDSGKDTTDSDTSGGDTDTSTDTSTDTGAQAAEDKSGAAVQTDGTSYSGTETWSLTADGGDGAILCQVQYTLSSTAVRTDCSDCSWAYDLVISDATLVTESGVGCAALDITDDDVSTLNGTTVSYGYAPSYYGHAQVLMVLGSTGWAAATFATYDDSTGDFSYDWALGDRSE